MTSDRESFPLSDLYDFRSGLSKPRSAFGRGYPFLTFKDVFYNTFVPKKLSDLVQSTDDERAKGGIQRGDVFLTRTSETFHELGMSCVALEDIPDATFNGFTKRLRPKPGSKIIPEYAAYYFRSLEFRDSVTAIASISTRASLNEEMLSRLRIVLPEENIQISIGKILKAFDDKIDLLREANATLEEMARSVFRDWFLDFEPVHAKVSGANSFRGMSQDLFDILPEKFEDSKIGEIPTGWELRPLDTIADFLNGLAMQKFRPKDGEDSLPVIKIAELRKGISGRTERASASIAEKYKIHDGDFIFSWSGSLLAKFWTDGDGALNQHLFKVTSKDYPIWFVACWVWSHMEQFQKIASSKATTMGHIQRRHLSEAMIVSPGQKVLSRMSDLVGPFFSRLISNELEAKTLAEIRDALLPMLISGEIVPPDLEALGSKVVTNGG